MLRIVDPVAHWEHILDGTANELYRLIRSTPGRSVDRR